MQVAELDISPLSRGTPPVSLTFAKGGCKIALRHESFFSLAPGGHGAGIQCTVFDYLALKYFCQAVIRERNVESD